MLPWILLLCGLVFLKLHRLMLMLEYPDGEWRGRGRLTNIEREDVYFIVHRLARLYFSTKDARLAVNYGHDLG